MSKEPRPCFVTVTKCSRACAGLSANEQTQIQQKAWQENTQNLPRQQLRVARFALFLQLNIAPLCDRKARTTMHHNKTILSFINQAAGSCAGSQVQLGVATAAGGGFIHGGFANCPRRASSGSPETHDEQTHDVGKAAKEGLPSGAGFSADQQ